MLNLKSCARCGGDLMIEELLGETELVCLQCGHRSRAPNSESPYATVSKRPVTIRKRRVSLRKAA
jgi:hypothetical protein